MSVNYLHPSVTGRKAGRTEQASLQAVPRGAEAFPVDWRAVRRADRACCCLARPAVIAILPPAPGRPHPTDLLLCGHHYRVSRQSLAAADATVLDLDGVPVHGRAWPSSRADG